MALWCGRGLPVGRSGFGGNWCRVFVVWIVVIAGNSTRGPFAVATFTVAPNRVCWLGGLGFAWVGLGWQCSAPRLIGDEAKICRNCWTRGVIGCLLLNFN